MPKVEAEVAVIGAGPAGSVAARHLGQAGVDVLLIDPGVYGPSHAIESLPPSGAPLAEDIGLLAAICEISDGPATEMRMLWRDASETRTFTGDGPLLLHRQSLHEMFRREASRVARPLQTRVRKIIATGATAELTTDAGMVSCRMIIDARGRHAIKRDASDLAALPFSATCGMPSHTMCLEAMRAGWLWACTLGESRVHGVLFQQAAVLAGMTAEKRLGYAQRCLSTSLSLTGAVAMEVSAPTAAGLSAVPDPILTARHLLVGDAALARDPVASHGLVHAMRSGVQAAIAVLTILDPAGDSHAARSFLRHKHREAAATAHRATARAYGDQCRFRSPFWSQKAQGIEAATPPQITSGPVTLTTPLTRAPVLDRDRIRWKPAIALPATQDFFTGAGPVTAPEIAAACRPAATLHDIAVRLGHVHAMPEVFEVLEHLALGGAFAQASEPV